MRKNVLAFLVLVGCTLRATADARLLPAEVTLTGPEASQRLLVVLDEGGKVTGDATADATFTSSDEKVARVSAKGEVRAVGDGEATITATAGEQKAVAKVKVSGTEKTADPSFRNE